VRIGAGRFRNALLPPAGPGVRPVAGRLRQSLFTVLLPRIEGARVLDLCAGVGGFGLEALSRGAASVVLVERDPRAVAALTRWIEQRGVGAEATVVRADARRGGWQGIAYDLVFVDPPFEAWGGGGGRRTQATLADDPAPNADPASNLDPASHRAPHADPASHPAPHRAPHPAPHPDPGSASGAADALAILRQAVASVAPGGLVVVKLPVRAVIPDDPRWRVLDRRDQGDVAWALLARAPPP
jgi:16S rRNA G966 N2-methylase RsmD